MEKAATQRFTEDQKRMGESRKADKLRKKSLESVLV